jgi:hypothetical protein
VEREAWAVWVEWACRIWNRRRLIHSRFILSILDKGTMQLGANKILAGAKYIYLIVFFSLLAGMFYPIITHTSWDNVILGTLILFLGLVGTVSIYKASTTDKHKKEYVIVGLTLTSIALFLVYAVIGKA